MSKFSKDWLALREPADIAARNRDVLAACKQYFAGYESLEVCDVGAGLGASLRAFADLLPLKQVWTLVDHDAENLNAALETLTRWADKAITIDSGLKLRHGPREIVVKTLDFELASSPECWTPHTGLVTASALFDLTSIDWISRFAAMLRAHRLPLLATLTFDGTICAEPVHPRDTEVRQSFLAHQHGDKGFGPAAGADAPEVLAKELTSHGYHVIHGESAWMLGQASRRLIDETLNGIANAAQEVGRIAPIEIEAWRSETLAAIRSLKIGHQDFFAQPR